jgi:hypothetical protein
VLIYPSINEVIYDPNSQGDGNPRSTRCLAVARFGIGATYDAHYLAVAEQEKADFWTIDRRLVSAVAAELPWVNLWL